MWRLLSCLLTLTLWAAPHLLADELPYAKPEDVGMSSSKLRGIEQAVGGHLDQNHLAGAVTLVLRQGRIVHFEAHGWRDLETRTPMTRDSIFRIYSMTKPIVSAAVMMLQEEGKLELDDPVHQYLPELEGLKVFSENGNEAAARPMSIRDLLRHTAGLTYGLFGDTPVDKQYVETGVLSPADDSASFLKKLSELPLLYQPGGRWVYSVAVDVQGILIERITGQSLERFLRERLFEPLGMEDTGFHVPLERRDRFAAVHGPDGDGGLQVNDAPATSAFRFWPRRLSGGGGLVSTASDYAKFLQMMLNGGELFGKRFLRADTVREMTRNQLPDAAYPIALGAARPGVGFGLGYSIRVEDTRWDADARIGEYGWDGLASLHFWVSPADNLAVITMEQTMPYTWHLARSLKGLIYDAIVP